MDLFNSLFSQILGGFGGATGVGGGQGVNPFSNAMGTLSDVVGGPASEAGTLFSLPGEMLTGVADLGTSKNIIGDVMGLTKPIESLGTKGLGGVSDLLSGLNPFGSGESGRLGGIIPYHYLPFLGIGALAAALERPQEEEM